MRHFFSDSIYRLSCRTCNITNFVCILRNQGRGSNESVKADTAASPDSVTPESSGSPHRVTPSTAPPQTHDTDEERQKSPDDQNESSGSPHRVTPESSGSPDSITSMSLGSPNSVLGESVGSVGASRMTKTQI